MVLTRAVSLAVLIGSILPAMVRAQDPAADVVEQTVPLDFFAVVLGRLPPDIIVGDVPADLPSGVPLEDVLRIVGSVHMPGGRTVVVAEVANGPDAALGAYEKTLESVGWRRPATPEPPRQGGFRSRGAASPPPSWCAGEQSLVAHAARLMGRTYLYVDVRPAARTPCDATLRLRRTGPDVLPLPALTAPEGTTVSGGARSSSGDRVSATTDLQTGAPVSALVEHFDAQLREAGWIGVDRSDADEIALRRYTYAGADGEAWDGSLALWRVGKGLIHATLLMERPTLDGGR